MEIMFPTTKIINTRTITFLRLSPENRKGMMGPDMATPMAKILTIQPAVATLTCSDRRYQAVFR